VVDNLDDLIKNSASLSKETGTSWYVVKAQIHAGGRGKGGGVKLAKNIDELKKFSSDILGMMLKTPQTPPEGKLVKKYLLLKMFTIQVMKSQMNFIFQYYLIEIPQSI